MYTFCIRSVYCTFSPLCSATTLLRKYMGPGKDASPTYTTAVSSTSLTPIHPTFHPPILSPPLIARRPSCVLASPSSMIGSNALTLMLANVTKCIASEWRACSTLCMRRTCAGVARNKMRSDSGVWMWMSCSSSGSVRGTNSRLGSNGTWTYAKARWAM